MARCPELVEVTLLIITMAGALGCVVRFLMEYAVHRRHPVARPWSTVGANVLGCALAGWATYHLTAALDAHLRTVVVTGFCGGLTTFSSAFAIPALLVKEHHWKYSVAIVVSTPILCGLFFAGGAALAH